MTTKSTSAEAMLKQLKNPFDPKFVKCRVGATSKDKKKGIALFYIDSREVQKRLDEICGIDGWQNKETVYEQGVICELSIRMPDGTWITKSDGGEFTKVSPIKGGCSDAFKRSAVMFGVGRYFYYIPNQWYPLNEYKQFDEQPQLPKWAMPNNSLENWEEIAIKEYDKNLDIDLENLDFVDNEAEEILKKSASKKAELIAKLKAEKK